MAIRIAPCRRRAANTLKLVHRRNFQPRNLIPRRTNSVVLQPPLASLSIRGIIVVYFITAGTDLDP